VLVVQFAFDVGLPDQWEQSRDVWLVHLAEACGDVGDSVVFVDEVVDDDPLRSWDVGNRAGFEREDDDVLVEDLVVLDVALAGRCWNAAAKASSMLSRCS